MDINKLFREDSELAACLSGEISRQSGGLEMIASESIQPRMCLELAGSEFNNKTAVGLPHKQRLKGSQYAAELERLAARRACEIFGADHANMLPYSGSMANFCAYSAVLEPGDRVLALAPEAGAHQTHGGAANISSRLYSFDFFGLDRSTLLIDYEEARRKVSELKPRLVVVGSAAYSRNIDYARLADIAHSGGAYLMADIAHFSGLIAAGMSPSPLPHADIVTASTTKTMCGPHSGFIMCREELREAVDRSVYPGNVASLHLQTIAAMAYALKRSQSEEFRSLMRRVVDNTAYFCEALKERGFDIVTGGSDCHMLVADLRPLGADAVSVADALEEIGITVNTKGIPYDPSPTPSGLRAGLTVLTQRGLDRAALDCVADIWQRVALAPKDRAVLDDCRRRVAEIATRFPIPDIYR